MVTAANPYRDQRTQYDPGMGMDELCDALNLGLYIGVTAPSGSAPTISSAIISFLQSGSGASATTLQDRGRLDVLITDFMTDAQKADALLPSPTLDHASAMASAILKLMGTQGSITTRGGAIRIPAGYRIRLATDPFGVLPNDGASVPFQSPLRIYGDCSDFQGDSIPFSMKGASIIDFRYTTSNNAKIDARGLGILEIDHLVIADTSGNSEPFLFFSNTTPLIHHNLFVGSKTSSWDQDCIILGGQSATIDGTSDAPFQGYGGQIYNNWFRRIRRAVVAQVFANAVPVHHNTVWNDCGYSTGAPFDYDGDPANVTVESIAGVPLHHNLVEMLGYKYGVKCREVSSSTIGPNDFYDPGGSTTAYYTFGDNANYNYIIGAYHDSTKTFVEETGTGANTNSWVTAHQSQETLHMQPFTVGNTLKRKNVSSATVTYLTGENSSGDTIEHIYYGSTDAYQVQHTPSGGSTQALCEFRDFGSGIVILTLQGTDTRIRSANSLILMDNPVQLASTLIWSGGATLTKYRSASAGLNFGAPGAVPGEKDLTITVTGAAVGDTVTLGLGATLPANYTVCAWVSATNTVTVRLVQYAGAAAGQNLGTCRVGVWAH